MKESFNTFNNSDIFFEILTFTIPKRNLFTFYHKFNIVELSLVALFQILEVPLLWRCFLLLYVVFVFKVFLIRLTLKIPSFLL